MENIWTLKAILRGFELVYDLKSCIYGLGVEHNFLEITSSLYCKISFYRLNYLVYHQC